MLLMEMVSVSFEVEEKKDLKEGDLEWETERKYHWGEGGGERRGGERRREEERREERRGGEKRRSSNQ